MKKQKVHPFKDQEILHPLPILVIDLLQKSEE